MIESIEYHRFVKKLQKLSDESRLNIKISHGIKDGEVIIVFAYAHLKFGLKYNKINHLTYENILEWVATNFEVKIEWKWLKEAMEAVRKEIEEEETREASKKTIE